MASTHWDLTYIDGADVDKAQARAGFSAFVPWIGSVTELRATVMGATRSAINRANGNVYYIDPADTTTADDGVRVIVSSDGKRYKLVPNTAFFSAGSNPALWADYWGGISAGANALQFATAYGYYGTNGSFRQGTFWNGYRNTSALWTSLGVNGSAAGCGWELGLDGFYIRAEATISGAQPVERARFNNAGQFGLGVTSITAQFHNNGTVRMQVFGAGTLVTDASGNVSASSDARLKEDVQPFAGGLAEVLQLRPVSYSWTAASGLDRMNRYVGLIAQEVETVLPEATGEDENGFLSIQDRPILAALINAAKELTARCATLEARVAQLEGIA